MAALKCEDRREKIREKYCRKYSDVSKFHKLNFMPPVSKLPLNSRRVLISEIGNAVFQMENERATDNDDINTKFIRDRHEL